MHDLRDAVKTFIKDRDWDQFHSLVADVTRHGLLNAECRLPGLF